MANSYKDIIITPNRANTADPKIEFRGANTTVNTSITLQTYPISNGMISFEGSAGQLFSITNDLSGSLFSVNDVSGIPSFEVLANGYVMIAPMGGSVVIGNTVFGNTSTSTTGKLVVSDTTPDQITATNPGTGHAYIAVNRATSGAGEVGFKIKTADGVNWYNYLGASSDTLRWYASGADRMTLTSGGVLTSTGDVRAPIFYDSDNTAYYVNPATGANLAGNIDTTGSRPISINPSSGLISIKGDAGGWATSLSFLGSSGTNRGGFGGSGAADSMNYLWIGAEYATPSVKVFLTGYAQANTSFRAPLFYDSDNTNYYIDAAGTSVLESLYLKGGIASSSNTAIYYDAALEVREFGFAGAQVDTWSIAPRISFHWAGRVASQIALNSSGQISILNSPGNDYEALRSGNFYAPIFYDSNDTAYYCNPNGTSKLATIEANAGARIVVQNGVDGGNTRGLSMWTDGDTNWAIYMGQSGASKSFSGGSAATSILGATAHHIRFRVANNDNQGFLWENGAESALMSLSGSSGNLAVKGNTRSTIFYDIDNTSYYVDSFSTSNMYRINSDGMSGNQFLVGTTNYADVSSGSTWYGIGRNTSDLLGLGGNTVQVAGYYGLRMRTSSATLDMYASYTQASGSLRAPIFYDSNDTNYYIDPNSSSVAYNFTANYFGQRAHGEPRNNLGDPTVTEMALFQEQFNNKTEFYPANNVIFETSTDGSTWSAYSVTDSQKKSFVGGDNSANISIPYNTAYFRVRFVNNGNYVLLNQLYSWWSSNGHQTKVHIYYKNYNSTTWVQHTSSNTLVSSWPGHLWLPFPTIGYNPSNPSQADEIAIVFIPTWNSTYSANPISLYKMQIWGGYPAGKRNIYSVDNDRNATFPVSVRAPLFHDSDNTAYYLDPASTSVVNVMRSSNFENVAGDGNGLRFWTSDDYKIHMSAAGNATWGGRVSGETTSDYNMYFRMTSGTNRGFVFQNGTTSVAGIDASGRIYSADGRLYLRNATANFIVATAGGVNSTVYVETGGFYVRDYSGTSTRLTINSSGNIIAGVDMRSPIFYDSDDTAYYVNPNGSTALFSNGLVVAGTEGFQSRIYTVNARNRIWSFNNADTYGLSYFQGTSGIGSNDTVGFHFGTATAAGSPFYVVSSGIAQASSSLRSPIFYDSDNTAYYVDATSTTNLNNITANTVTIGLGNSGGVTPVKTFSVVTNSQGANNATYELCRISRDAVNWSTNVLEITVYNLYMRGGMSRWVVSYNQVDAGTVELMAEAGTIPHKLYLGNEVTVAGNIRYRPILIDLPAYTIANIEMKYKYNEVTSISNAGQLQFTGTYTTNASASGTASTTTAIIANNSIYWNGIALPAAGTSFGNPNTIGRSDSNGYTFFNYINSNTGNSENPTISQIIVTNGSDNYYRKASLAHLKSSLGTIDTANNATYAYGKQESQLAVASATTATTATYLNSAASSSTKDDITTRTNSGFWESSTGTTAEGWPLNNGSWQHLLASTHSNGSNYYSMQLAADFYTNSLFYRSTNGSGTTAWNRVALYNNAYSDNLRATVFYDNDNTAYYFDGSASDSINVFGNINVVSGELNFTGSGAKYIDHNGDLRFRYSDNSTFFNDRIFIAGSGNYTQFTGSARAPIFYDSDNTAFYFDGAGTTNINTLFGNGKTVLSTGDTYLRINENMAFTNGTWFGGTMITSTAYYAGGNGGTTNSRVHIAGGTYNGTRVLFLDGSDGSISAAGNITAYSSDKRLKTNVNPIENALQKVMSIGGYTFDWDDKVDELGFIPDTRTNDAGVLAQEIQAVLPQAVAPAPFDWQWDEEQEKNASKSGENYLTVRYERIVPLLIEAIKEQQAYINRLEEKIDTIVQKLEDK